MRGSQMSARILIVEDDAILQEAIKSALEGKGFKVDATADGFCGLELLRKGSYDLALLDYQLPEMDGYVSARVFRGLTVHSVQSCLL